MRLPNSQSSRAVIIGTAAYDVNSGFSALPAVENNLMEIENFLRTQTGLQHIVNVTNPPAAVSFGDALSSAVEEADDLLLFYYSGHGTTVNDELVLTYSASSADKAKYTTVPYSAIREDIARSSASIKVVILDCCYSGKVHGKGYLGNLADENIDDQTVIEGAYVLTATGTTRNFASASGNGGCTAFTGAFLDVLRAGTRPQDQFISLATLFPLLQARLRGENHPTPRSSGRNTAYGLALSRNPQWLESQHKRFFRNRDVELPIEDFTAIGVGYISGDSSPGPILADRMRLVAAFDDDYIFIDPDPTAILAARERQRIFGQPEGTWQEYDRNLISTGGGIWSREAPSIPISPQASVALDLHSDITEVSPADLIDAVLRAPVDVLLNGGARILIKASVESIAALSGSVDGEVHVDASSVRAAVICEAGNRIATPRAQVEFLAAGGRFERIEPDSGVGGDQNYEGNLEIIFCNTGSSIDGFVENDYRDSITRASNKYRLQADVQRSRVLRTAQRERLPGGSRIFSRLIEELRHTEKESLSEVEFPFDTEIERRAQRGQGLTTWELAQLAACEEIRLSKNLAEWADAPSRLWLHALPQYFSDGLWNSDLRDKMQKHPHLRMIGAELIARDMIYLGGIGYVKRITEQTMATIRDVASAFELSTEILGLRRIVAEIWQSSLPESEKIDLVIWLRSCLDGMTRWFINNRPRPASIGFEFNQYSRGAESIRAVLAGLKESSSSSFLSVDSGRALPDGLPSWVSDDIRFCEYWPDLLNMVDIHMIAEVAYSSIVGAYISARHELPIGRVRSALLSGFTGGRWHDVALVLLHEEASMAMRNLVLYTSQGDVLQRRLDEWEKMRARHSAWEPGSNFVWSPTWSYDLARLSILVGDLSHIARYPAWAVPY
ncbi:NAD-glutamate dehydrogenase domain-containing protein [Nocardia sp. NPDC051833]|uniref:caspase, EACC1-associated type n=1 Tax=Nocardia sp. NPDC051833 TaxID=3155674 RepID=UPI00344A9B59